MSTIEGITYKELRGTDSGSKDRRMRVYKVAWSDMWAFIAAMMGWIKDTGAGYVQSKQPVAYAPDQPNVLAIDFGYRGLGKIDIVNGKASYQAARVEIMFGVPEDPNTQTGVYPCKGAASWADESSNYRVEMQPLPGHSLYWKGTSPLLKVEQSWGVPYVVGEITLTRYNVATINRGELIGASGCVNQKSFRDFPAGTLLWMGFSPKRSISSDGKTSAYTLVVSSQHKPTGWNKLFRPGYGWRDVLVDNESPPFPEYDFNTL